jgi:hypothetical protein
MPQTPIDPAIPGADLVRAGLWDLAAGRITIEGLLVLQARRRLLELGYAMPDVAVEDPGARMYALIAEELGGPRAHGRYNALRRRLASFINAASIADAA